MATETIQTLAIHQAMVAVASDLSKIGIAKDRKNEQQGFRFRGIDDVMNAVSPLFAKHEIVFLPRYTDYPDVERVTKTGATLIYSKVKGEFTFVSAKDGSSVSVTTFGVAMDAADKSTNKSMSAALKYCLLETFLIPTESSEDADATTPEPSVPKPAEGFEEWFVEVVAVAPQGYNELAAAWRTSPEPHRTYALKYRKDMWEKAKADARAVTAARTKAAAAQAGAK